MMSGKVLKIVEYEKGYTPNGVVVTTLSTGVTRMFVGQTEPYAAILIYDNNGNGFELFKELKTDGSEDSIGTIPENKELRVFCDGISLHNGFIYTSCSGGVRVNDVETLEFVGQVYTNNLNANNYVADGWLYMTANHDVIRVKLKEKSKDKADKTSSIDIQSPYHPDDSVPQ